MEKSALLKPECGGQLSEPFLQESTGMHNYTIIYIYLEYCIERGSLAVYCKDPQKILCSVNVQNFREIPRSVQLCVSTCCPEVWNTKRRTSKKFYFFYLNSGQCNDRFLVVFSRLVKVQY